MRQRRTDETSFPAPVSAGFGVGSAPMARLGLLAALFVGIMGCATYRDDFDRARLHYDANEYDAALLLLEVLERDIDSLSVPERAQYAYYRGMSHYRLEQKRDARHWLGNADARERASEGALNADAKARVKEILRKLNAPYFGESQDGSNAKLCKTDLDCTNGAYCDAGQCTGESNAASSSSKDDDGKAAERPQKKNKKKKPEMAMPSSTSPSDAPEAAEASE